jgi:hypothetical protein
MVYPHYRPLLLNETIEAGDEWSRDGRTWQTVQPSLVGCTAGPASKFTRTQRDFPDPLPFLHQGPVTTEGVRKIQEDIDREDVEAANRFKPGRDEMLQAGLCPDCFCELEPHHHNEDDAFYCSCEGAVWVREPGDPIPALPTLRRRLALAYHEIRLLKEV